MAYSEEDLHKAFDTLDITKSGTITVEDYLEWAKKQGADEETAWKKFG